MIDDATLRRMEAENIACGDAENEWIIRTARRYLALRNAAKTQEGRVRVQAIFFHMVSRKDIDAAADRLLEKNRE